MRRQLIVIMFAGGHGDANPNTNWLQSRGLWLAYTLGMLSLHLVLLSVPVFSVPVAWTLTNALHNLAHLWFLHSVKGAPWISADQGACRRLTHWEQIDDGMQFTVTRKFLTFMPIFLFLLTCIYTRYDTIHFVMNSVLLFAVLLPKMPQFHKVRLFGINKY